MNAVEKTNVKNHDFRKPTIFSTNMTTKEAAEYLRISTSTLYKMIARNEITHTRVGGTILFSKNKLDEFLKRNENIV